MTGFSKQVREVVKHRAGGVCERCGWAAPAYQFHHRRPRAMGGSRSPETNGAANCLHLCVPCHCACESDRELSLRHGWLVRQSRDPRLVPVFRMGTWVQLNDDGSYETRGPDQ